MPYLTVSPLLSFPLSIKSSRPLLTLLPLARLDIPISPYPISHGSCFMLHDFPSKFHSTTASLAFRSLRNCAIVFTVPSACLIWLSTRVCRLISILPSRASYLLSHRPWNSQISETRPRLSIPSQPRDATIQVSSCPICG